MSAAFVGIFAGLAIASLFLISPTIHLLALGLALTLASSLYLVVKNRKEYPDAPFAPSTKAVIEIFFFMLMTASSLVLFSGEGRPLLYFVLISLAVGFLSLAIIDTRSNAGNILQIGKIFLVSFNLKYSIFSLYEGSGVDYWVHLQMNGALAFNGFISVLSGKEASFPLMHVQVAIHQILTDLPIKDASNSGLIVPLVLSSICVFLIARRIFDARVGLLAMLVVNITDYMLYWGAAPQTTTYGIALYYFLVFVLFRFVSGRGDKAPWLVVLIILMPTIVLAHAISSYIVLMTLIGLLVGSFLYRAIFDHTVSLNPPIAILFAYGVILIQHWFVALYDEIQDRTFFEVVTSTFDIYVTEHAAVLNRPEAISRFAATLPPFIERFANTTGLAILMLLAATGALFWLSRKSLNRNTFSMLVCATVLMCFTFVFPLFGIRNIIPSRWFAFFYLFLGIMAGFALFTLTRKIPIPRLRLAALFICIVPLTFFMIGSTVSNLDSPLWLKGPTISTSYTFQEAAGAKTLAGYSEFTVKDPNQWLFLLTANSPQGLASLNPENIGEQDDSLIIWRSYMERRSVRTYTVLEGYYKTLQTARLLGGEYLTALQQHHKVYDNNDISGYYLRTVDGM